MRGALILVTVLLACDSGARSAERAAAVPAAVAIVLSDNEWFMGNDDYDTSGNSPWIGHLKSFAAMLDTHPLAAHLPAGSRGAVIGYSTGSQVIVPMGPIDRLTGTALGPQLRYRGRNGTDVAQGVGLGLEELAKVDAKRRLLIVFGDGVESVEEREKLAPLRVVADKHHVEILQIRSVHIDAISTTALGAVYPVPTPEHVTKRIQDHLRGAPQAEGAAYAPAALILVVNTQEIWVGNDTYEQDENARYQGAFVNIADAIERESPAALLPEGSIGGIVGYSTGAEMFVRMGPIERVNAAFFKDQRPHRGKIGTDMVKGIEFALTQMLVEPAARKIVIVIGDGNDTNNERAKTELMKLRAKSSAARIELHGIALRHHCYGSVLEPVYCTGSSDGVAAALHAILAR